MLLRFPILCSDHAYRRLHEALELSLGTDDARLPRAGVMKQIAG